MLFFAHQVAIHNNVHYHSTTKAQHLLCLVIEYESNQQIRNDKKFNKYNVIGCIALTLALFHNVFGYLDYIFTPNAGEFVQGLLYGICICVNIISLYNRSHNISLCEKKKELIKKLSKK